MGGGQVPRFFYLMVSHNTLTNYYDTNFKLSYHHKYPVSEIENFIIFERDIYIGLLSRYIDSQKE